MKYFDKLNQLLDKADSSHPLLISKNKNISYFSSFLKSMNYLSINLSEKEIKTLLRDKLLLEHDYNQFRYIQAACEVTVSSFFSRKFEDTFAYEVNVTPNNNKDVDCQIESNGLRFNIEVKCPDLEKRLQDKGEDTLQIFYGTRFPNITEVDQDINNITLDIIGASNSPYKTAITTQRLDNKLKDFLIDAHKKFNDSVSEQEINVLVIALNTREDFDEWFAYLNAYGGLFEKSSYMAHEKYNNVDLVVFSNLVNGHLYFEDTPIADAWDFGSYFNIVYSNCFRKKDKKAGICHFINFVIPNYSNELSAYFNTLQFPINLSGIKAFITEEQEKKSNLYLFK